jgi:hypothetical protein
LGGEITIEPGGVVEQDLMAAGQTVTIRGQVMDDVRIAGAALVVMKTLRSAATCWAPVTAWKPARQRSCWRFIFVGGQALLARRWKEMLMLRWVGWSCVGPSRGRDCQCRQPGAEYRIPPTVFMPGMPEVPSVASGLRVAEGAQIGGNLEYTGQAEAAIPAGAVAGQVERNEPVAQEVQPRNVVLDWFLITCATWLPCWLSGFTGLDCPGSSPGAPQPCGSSHFQVCSGALSASSAVFFVLFVLVVIVVILAIFFGFITLGSLVSTIIGLGLLAALP